MTIMVHYGILSAANAFNLLIAFLLGAAVIFLLGKVSQKIIKAKRDELTGLLNQAAAVKEVEKIIQKPEFKKGAMIVVDLDNFKKVNETLGFKRGDEALIECASLLRQLFEEKDVICRMARNEFFIFFPYNGDLAILENKVEKILQLMHIKVFDKEKIVTISGSLGVAIAPEHGTGFDKLYRNAKEALYQSKTLGRDCASIWDMDWVIQNPEKPADSAYGDRKHIMIVDDDAINREIIKVVLADKYSFIEAENGLEGLKKIEKHEDEICAILLDVTMPIMNGLEVLEKLQERNVTSRIPVFMITAHNDSSIIEQAYAHGVLDVINKPINSSVIQRRVQLVVELFQSRDILKQKVDGQKEQLKEKEGTIDLLQRNTIEALASAIEFRDIESGEHTNRMYDITKYILSHTSMGEGFTRTEIENMALGAIMHDIGKIAISDVILNKPGKLSKAEFDEMKLHTVKGGVLMEKLLETQDHPSYQYGLDIARHHHERWDGNGYPDGLKGDEITVWSQVVSLADVYDALVSPRVYKRAFDPDKAVRMICGGECGVFNPKLIEAFLQVEPVLRTWYVIDKEQMEQEQQAAAAMTEGEKATQSKEAKTFGQPSKELVDILLLTTAIKSTYEMIISCNLTRNSYYMMDYERSHINQATPEGVYDDLLELEASSVPESHRQIFMDTYSRENLLKEFENGAKEVHLEHPQLIEDGRIVEIASSFLLMKDPKTGDVRSITLARYLGEIRQ